MSSDNAPAQPSPFALRADRDYLVTQQYRDADNLNARMALHKRFGVNQHPWQRWVFELLLDALTQTPPTEPDQSRRILEIGCGPARLWVENADRIPANWTITLTDLSAGMLVAAQRGVESAFFAEQAAAFSYIVADAQSLPFDGGIFDAVVANHMLYHVPDRSCAIGEIRRVLRPGGSLIAATNGETHLRELDALSARFLPETGDANRHFSEDFTLENGEAQLKTSFNSVEMRRHEGGLVVTEAEPIVAYIASMVAVAPGNLLTDERLVALRAYLEQEIATHGAIHIMRDSGVFIAR
ncbi:MAG TPA: class I SAM-dependent methyltransferase [Ktedonobacterales bacterium]|nr:class I SAM-dependent methyltransferase [Ktedonobacterales bacterium]